MHILPKMKSLLNSNSWEKFNKKKLNMFKSNRDSNRFLQLTNDSSNPALVMYTILFARKSSSCIRTGNRDKADNDGKSEWT